MSTEKEREMAEILAKTLETYRKNKTQVPASELEGRYKAAFMNLIKKLQGEAEALLNEILTSGFQILKSDGEPLVEAFKESYKVNKIGSRISRALFEHYSMDEFYKIAREQRTRNEELYQMYIAHHICLYAPPECFEDGSDTEPLIYNDVTEEFYDTETKVWKKMDKPKSGAVIMRILKEREVEG